MNPLNPWPVVMVFVLVLATTQVLTGLLPQARAAGRFDTLDGLRGFLAFGVFAYHGAVWYFYLHTGRWEDPGSTYGALRETCVALFFMITGFLFWTKLLDGRSTPAFDWTRLYVSRVLRLTPLYYFALFAGGICLGATMHFQLREPLAQLAMEIVRWASFTILHTPAVNGTENAWIVWAGVVWTLPYEWLFYCSLPVAGLLTGVRTPWPWVVGALVMTAGLVHYVQPDLTYLAAFGGGILSAYLVRSPTFCATARSPFATGFAVLALGFTVLAHLGLHHSPALVLLTAVFAVIASGNSLGGLLTRPAARLAGEITYSVYLLHGLVLYAVFNFILGATRAAAFTPLEHWLVIFACVPLTVVASCATFRWIEAPAMRRTAPVTSWIQSHRTGGP